MTEITSTQVSAEVAVLDERVKNLKTNNEKEHASIMSSIENIQQDVQTLVLLTQQLKNQNEAQVETNKIILNKILELNSSIHGVKTQISAMNDVEYNVSGKPQRMKLNDFAQIMRDKTNVTKQAGRVVEFMQTWGKIIVYLGVFIAVIFGLVQVHDIVQVLK